MVDAQSTQTAASITPEPSRRRRSVARMVAAGGIVIGTLAVAGPSWAGPLMGC